MAENLLELRNVLDDIMCKCLNRRVVLYGGGYTGSYIRWYAKYWHGIDIAFEIRESYTAGTAQDKGLFMPTIISNNYKDIRQCIIWIVDCEDCSQVKKMLKEYGYIENETFFELCQAVYGDDLYWPEEDKGDIFNKYKHGKRDIQDLEWLEWKYGCNFITPVSTNDFIDNEVTKFAVRYSATPIHDIFEMLSRSHININSQYGFFDFGCGKGGVIVAALEYGFKNVGGVEFEPRLYEVLKSNFEKLDTFGDKLELICGDAAKLETELDKYNVFHLYNPFRTPIMEQVIKHISESIKRNRRKVYILDRCYYEAGKVLRDSPDFRLCNRFEINTANRMCEIFESVI